MSEQFPDVPEITPEQQQQNDAIRAVIAQDERDRALYGATEHTVKIVRADGTIDEVVSAITNLPPKTEDKGL